MHNHDHTQYSDLLTGISLSITVGVSVVVVVGTVVVLVTMVVLLFCWGSGVRVRGMRFVLIRCFLLSPPSLNLTCVSGFFVVE